MAFGNSLSLPASQKLNPTMNHTMKMSYYWEVATAIPLATNFRAAISRRKKTLQCRAVEIALLHMHFNGSEIEAEINVLASSCFT